MSDWDPFSKEIGTVHDAYGRRVGSVRSYEPTCFSYVVFFGAVIFGIFALISGAINGIGQMLTGGPSPAPATTISTEAAAPPTTVAPATAEPPVDPVAATAAVSGSWAGSYTCPEGSRGLTLTIDATPGSVSAVFNFYPLPDSPAKESGAFSMQGYYNVRTRSLTLQQDKWISQPEGYYMLNLSGNVWLDGVTMSGTVPDCEKFEIHKQ